MNWKIMAAIMAVFTAVGAHAQESPPVMEVSEENIGVVDGLDNTAAAAEEKLVRMDQDTGQIFDLETNQPTGEWAARNPDGSFVYDADGTLVMVTEDPATERNISVDNGTGQVFDLETDQPTGEWAARNPDGSFVYNADGTIAMEQGQGTTTTEVLTLPSPSPQQTTREVVVKNTGNFSGFQDHGMEAEVISNETYRRGLAVDGFMSKDAFLAALQQRVDLMKSRFGSVGATGLPKGCRSAKPEEVTAYMNQVGNWVTAMGNRPASQEALADILRAFEVSGSLDLSGVIVAHNRDSIARNLASTASGVYGMDVFAGMVEVYQSRPICESLDVVDVEGTIPPAQRTVLRARGVDPDVGGAGAGTELNAGG